MPSANDVEDDDDDDDEEEDADVKRRCLLPSF